MAHNDFIPRPDDAFDLWQNNLYNIVVQHQPDSDQPWGYPATLVNTFAELKLVWSSKWLVAQNKGTRTPADVQAKDTARENLEHFLRQFIREWLAFNSLVSDDDRVEMQITVRDTTPTPAPIPITTPDTDLKPGNGNQVVIFFTEGSDEPGASGSAKPEGVSRMEARYKVGAPAPATPADCPANAESGRSPMRIDFTAAQAGLRLYLFFRWINTRNQPGPWTGSPANIIIPG